MHLTKNRRGARTHASLRIGVLLSGLFLANIPPWGSRRASARVWRHQRYPGGPVRRARQARRGRTADTL